MNRVTQPSVDVQKKRFVGAVGVIGLGNMGQSMAVALKRNGFDVVGFDLSPKALSAAAHGGVKPAGSIREVCERATTIVLALPTASVVQEVVCGEDGILPHGRAGSFVIDTSTSDPGITRQLAAQLSERAIRLIDAPVSGGPKSALNGQLTMIMGGEKVDLAEVEPVLSAMSAKRVHVGAVGAGHVTKIVNNLLCATHLIAAAEAVRMAKEAGVDPAQLIEGINACSGRSGITQINYPTWILNESFDSGFTMALMRKDVELALELAKQLQLVLPLSKESGRLWAASESRLSGDEDFNRIVSFRDS